MRQEHKRIIRITQILIVGLLFFALLGVLDGVLWLVGEVSLTEAIEYLEVLAGAEGLTISAYLYKRIRKGEFVIEEFLNYLMGLVDGTYDNDSEADAKIKEVERCKLKYELKKLRRK